MAIPSQLPTLTHRTHIVKRLGGPALLAVLLVAGACSERPGKKAAAGKAAAVKAGPARKPIHCPLAGNAVSERGIAGIELGQPTDLLKSACRSARTVEGLVSPSLREAWQGLWLLAESDTVRVLASAQGQVVELDALTPGFVSADSIRVGHTLAQVLSRRPNAARSGAVQILQNQLVVGSRPGCGVLAVLSDDRQGQQISLTPEEVSRLPGGLRVKRLSVIRCLF